VKFSHVALNCRDIQVTQNFYERYFGFQHARTFDLGGGAQIVFIRNAEGVYLELFQAEGEGTQSNGDGSHAQRTLRHIAFQVEDVDLVLSRIGSEAQVSLGPLDFDAFIPGWRTVWLRDPDGNIVEVTQGYQDA
jgi:glyoxylase I family protein